MPDRPDPSAAFAAAQRRFHEAVTVANDMPTHAGALAALDAAIEDYNRAVDAYNAAYGLVGTEDTNVLKHLSRDEYVGTLTAALDPQPVREIADRAAERVRNWIDGRTATIDPDDVREVYVTADRASRDLANARGEIRALQAEREQLAARVAELETELRKLRGTELNPSPMILDAESYRDLRDELAATMTDNWDGDEAESWILIRYVRWLAAGQPRDEDGYPVRREIYSAAEVKQAQAEHDADVRAVAAVVRGRSGGYREARAINNLAGQFAGRIAALDDESTTEPPATCHHVVDYCAVCGCPEGNPAHAARRRDRIATDEAGPTDPAGLDGSGLEGKAF